MSPLADEVRASLLGEGFARVGFARAEVPEPEATALDAFLARGDHGDMAWMERSRDVRRDPSHPGLLRGARSVIVALATAGDEPIDLSPGRVARYARGRDYHRVLSKRLEATVRLLEARGHRARPAVDSKPLLERAFAYRAGLGFIGKNACLIAPGLGSHVLLACIVTDADLPAGTPLRDGCGSCRACLDACPTGAFRAERSLDARRCISYLTIEREGGLDAQEEMGVGPWILGCDVCQDVCPYNAGRARDVDVMPGLARPHVLEGLSAEMILAMDEAAFKARFEGTPFARPGRAQVARNAAIALGNAGEGRHLPILQRAADHDVPVVREAAVRAAQRLEARSEAHSSSEPGSSSSG